MNRKTEVTTTGSTGLRFRQTGQRQWLPAALLLLALFVMATSAACGPTDQGENVPEEVRLAPVSQLSAKVMSAPPVVQEAYRFALANPELLEELPCYCGCGTMGHQNNLGCFVQDLAQDGSVVFDYHALG